MSDANTTSLELVSRLSASFNYVKTFCWGGVISTETISCLHGLDQRPASAPRVTLPWQNVWSGSLCKIRKTDVNTRAKFNNHYARNLCSCNLSRDKPIILTESCYDKSHGSKHRGNENEVICWCWTLHISGGWCMGQMPYRRHCIFQPSNYTLKPHCVSCAKLWIKTTFCFVVLIRVYEIIVRMNTSLAKP